MLEIEPLNIGKGRPENPLVKSVASDQARIKMLLEDRQAAYRVIWALLELNGGQATVPHSLLFRVPLMEVDEGMIFEFVLDEGSRSTIIRTVKT